MSSSICVKCVKRVQNKPYLCDPNSKGGTMI